MEDRLHRIYSDNHYNFEPSDRETSFGTMENVKSFRVFFSTDMRKTASSPISEPSASPGTSPGTPVFSLLGSAFYTKEQEKYDISGTVLARPDRKHLKTWAWEPISSMPATTSARVMSAKLDAKPQGTEAQRGGGCHPEKGTYRREFHRIRDARFCRIQRSPHRKGPLYDLFHESP